jgi:hypothetical protein
MGLARHSVQFRLRRGPLRPMDVNHVILANCGPAEEEEGFSKVGFPMPSGINQI